MSVRWVSVFLDVPPDLIESSQEFWSRVTETPPGRAVGLRGEFLPLERHPDEASLWLQRIQDGPVSAHVDLYAEDVAGQVERAIDLGATRVGALDELDVVVMASPGGLPFCVVRYRGQGVRMAPVGRDGERSVVDQVCLDIPASRYDEECDFWAALTCWALTDEHPNDEFRRLTRPSDIPYAFLLQRLESRQPEQSAVSAHLDLACEDRDAETARHIGLGASVVRRTDGWTVMRDPVGLTYCNTGRRPSVV